MAMPRALNRTDRSKAHRKYVFSSAVGVPRVANAARTIYSHIVIRLGQISLDQRSSIVRSLGFFTNPITLLVISDG